jgi:SMI1-KNR4 cell-wall
MGLQEEAVALLNYNNEDFILPTDAFVFSMHQGYEFKYFKTSEGDDPPVYQYVEGNGHPPVMVWNSFSSYLTYCIAQHT